MSIQAVNSNNNESLFSKTAKAAALGGAAAAGGSYIRSRYILQQFKDVYTPSDWKEYKSEMLMPNLKEAGKTGLIAAGIAGVIAAGVHFLKGSKAPENQE